MGLKPGVQALSGELARQHHGVGYGAIGTIGVRHAMQGNGGGVEVPFPVDSRSVDKLLVFRDTLRRFQVLAQKDADRLEIEVEDAVRLGQQTGRLGRRLGAQEDRNCQQQQVLRRRPKRSSRAFVHGTREAASGLPLQDIGPGRAERGMDSPRSSWRSRLYGASAKL